MEKSLPEGVQHNLYIQGLASSRYTDGPHKRKEQFLYLAVSLQHLVTSKERKVLTISRVIGWANYRRACQYVLQQLIQLI